MRFIALQISLQDRRYLTCIGIKHQEDLSDDTNESQCKAQYTLRGLFCVSADLEGACLQNSKARFDLASRSTLSSEIYGQGGKA